MRVNLQTGFRASFGAHFAHEEHDSNTEVRRAKQARSAKVDIPIYNTTSNDTSVSRLEYTTKGEIASAKTNPVNRKHLTNLFKNLFYLDKAGICHDLLSKDHIFFSKNGDVELDCFRYSYNFVKKPNKTRQETEDAHSIKMPNFVMPSNSVSLETLFLSDYINDIRGSAQKDDFIRSYLKEKSKYHQKRTDMLASRGFKPLDDTVQYEVIQSEVFKNPTMTVMDYTESKAKLFKKLDIAYNSYDEQAAEKALAYFDCLIDILKLKENARISSLTSSNDDESKYFAFESEILNKIFEDYRRDTLGVAEEFYLDDLYDSLYEQHDTDYCANNDKIVHDNKAKRKLFMKLYSDIDPDNKTMEENISIIQGAKNIFDNDTFMASLLNRY